MLMKLYIYLETYLSSRFMSMFMARDDTPGAHVLSKCTLWARGLVPVSEL